MTADLFSEIEVRKAIDLLVEPGNVFEIRALDAKLGNKWKTGIVSGYFDNAENAVAALANISEAMGIYITLNPVVPDLLARRCNRLDYAKTGDTTNDRQITRRRWLVVDTDPERPTGVSSTNDELSAAIQRANEVEKFLTEQGFPNPVKARSGNGGHLLYRVDLAADDGGLVDKVIKSISHELTDPIVTIDVKMGNPARITKLYGTLACKGDNFPNRPHRFSQVCTIPKPLEIVPKELLKKVAALLPPVSTTATTATTPTATTKTFNAIRHNGRFDLRQFLTQQGIAVKSETVKGDMTVIELQSCPFNPDHGGHGEVAVFENVDGRLGFKCHHNSCDGNHWREFRRHYEPTYNPDPMNVTTSSGVLTYDQLASAAVTELPTVRSLDQFAHGDNNGGNLLGNRFLCRSGGLLLAAPTGIGKSSWAFQAATSWALGLPHLGIKPVGKLKSLIIQAENDDGDIAELRDGIFRGLNLTPEQLVEACSSVKVVCESSMTATAFIEMVAGLVEQHHPDLLWIDPLFAFLGDSVTEQKAVSAFLRNGLNPILQRYGCGLVLIHHTNKPQQGKEKSDWKAGDFAYMGSGTGELANWARAVIAIRSLGEHDVFEMVFGKRGKRVGLVDAWQQPIYSVFIRHSSTGICWETGDAPIGKRKFTKQDVLNLIPATCDISQTRLFNAATDVGIGEKRCRGWLKELIEDDKTVHVWLSKRSGTNAAKSYSRHPQRDIGAETLAEENLVPKSTVEVVGRDSERETFAGSLPIGAKKSLPIPSENRGDSGDDFGSPTAMATAPASETFADSLTDQERAGLRMHQLWEVCNGLRNIRDVIPEDDTGDEWTPEVTSLSTSSDRA